MQEEFRWRYGFWVEHPRSPASADALASDCDERQEPDDSEPETLDDLEADMRDWKL